MQYAFYFNMKICSECRTCSVACKDKNDLPTEINYRKVSVHEGGKFPEPWVYFLSMACNHCQKPICVEKCPVGAMHKREEDGIVLVNTEACVGCGTCGRVCPYGVPQYSIMEGNWEGKKRKARKCDLCIDLLEKGEKPACVTACTCRALDFGELKDLKKKYGGGDSIRILPPPGLTRPSLIIRAKKEAKTKGKPWVAPHQKARAKVKS